MCPSNGIIANLLALTQIRVAAESISDAVQHVAKRIMSGMVFLELDDS